jgi:iron complex outermembrane receptor protein
MGIKGMVAGVAWAPAGALLALGLPAVAQESGLGEIVVTAQKREQSLQDVPERLMLSTMRFSRPGRCRA